MAPLLNVVKSDSMIRDLPDDEKYDSLKNDFKGEVKENRPRTSSAFSDDATMLDNDLAEKSAKGTYRSLGKSAATESWALELFALLTSLSSFAAILVILATYHEKPQPRFAHTVININTLVAIASTILRATMVFVVSEVIGQSKWLWMEKPRPLRDVERFDDAARGVWGSLKLFFYSLKPTLALIGSFIMITSYAVGPFSQQAATTYSCNITSEGLARISIAKYVSNSREDSGSGLTPEMQAMAINGLMYGGPGNNLLTSNLFECSSGNCTFDSHSGVTHSSVGVCSTCTDVTDTLQKFDKGRGNGTDFGFTDDERFSLTWPPDRKGFNIFSILGTHDRRTTEKSKQSAGSMSSSDSLWKDPTMSIMALTAANCTQDSSTNNSTERNCNQQFGTMEQVSSKTTSPDVGIVAANCTLYPCLRHYNANITSNVLDERLVSQEPMMVTWMRVYSEKSKSWTADEWYGYYIKMTEPCVLNGKWYDASNISTAQRADRWTSWRAKDGIIEYPTECLNIVTPQMVGAIGEFLANTVAGDCNDTTRNILRPNGEPLPPNLRLAAMFCGDKWWVDSLFKRGNATFGTISTAFDGMATAMTNYMRTKGLRYSGEYSDLASQTFVTGSERQTAICVRANWAWLAYPGGLLVITTVLLVSAWVQSYQGRSRRPVWKSAVLPLLFYDVNDGKEHDESVPLLQLSELRSLADKTVARFSVDAETPGFIVEKSEQAATS